MPFAVLARGIALLLFSALYPALAFGLVQTYEGKLVPDNGSAPIPIVVEFNDTGTFLRGNVKTSSPVRGSAPIESGGKNAGQCTVNVAINTTMSLRLKGTCDQKSYVGTYALLDGPKRLTTIGSFQLTGKASEAAKPDAARGTQGAMGTATACMKSNTHCLSACPRDDSTAAALCANHCRTKYKTCKAPPKKPPVVAE